MIFSEFLAKQESIYTEFRNTSKIELEGIIPKIFENQGGYIIAYRHSENIIEGIKEFSEKISRIVPSIIYNEGNIHTTLATFQVSDNFVFDKILLKNIINSVHASVPLIKKVEIEYTEWLMNQDSGIVGGIPNPAFFENIKKVVEYAMKAGIQLKSPWGAHITISRFLESVSKEQTLELLNLFKNSKPLGLSKIEYVDVGYSVLTPKEFKLNIYERFKITKQ